MPDEATSFSSVKARLDEIAEEVSREGISLDDALALYEEAVKLGLAACDLSESDLVAASEQDAQEIGSASPVQEPVREPIEDDIAYAGETEGV